MEMPSESDRKRGLRLPQSHCRQRRARSPPQAQWRSPRDGKQRIHPRLSAPQNALSVIVCIAGAPRQPDLGHAGEYNRIRRPGIGRRPGWGLASRRGSRSDWQADRPVRPAPRLGRRVQAASSESGAGSSPAPRMQIGGRGGVRLVVPVSLCAPESLVRLDRRSTPEPVASTAFGN